MNPELRALASDPGSTPEMLRWLAADYPELRSLIQQNPACYPELSAWIDEQHGFVGSAAGWQQAEQQAMVSESKQQSWDTASPSGLSSAAAKTAPSKGALVAVLVGVAAVATIGFGIVMGVSNAGGGGLNLAFGVSREQGCQNLADALIRVSNNEVYLGQDFPDYDSYELEDLEALMYDSLESMGTTLSAATDYVSDEIGNKEVRMVWDEYGALLERIIDPAYFFEGSFTEESFLEIMEEEARILNRLDDLCPNVDLGDSLDSFGTGSAYGFG